MKRWFIGLICLILLFLPSSISNASSILYEVFTIKVNINMNHIEYEWDYINPDKFKYEEGDRVVRGKIAEQKVRKMIRTLNLSKKAKVEEMVKSLKKNGFNNIDTLEIRLIDQNDELYTWVWHGKD